MTRTPGEIRAIPGHKVQACIDQLCLADVETINAAELADLVPDVTTVQAEVILRELADYNLVSAGDRVGRHASFVGRSHGVEGVTLT